MNFDVLLLRLGFASQEPRGNLANFWRGRLGAGLRQLGCDCAHPATCPRLCPYGQIFSPPSDPTAPSGMRDPVRPFVLRSAALDQLTLSVFDTVGGTRDLLLQALKPCSWAAREVSIDLRPRSPAERSLEVRFLTPTDIRTSEPDFGTVFSRARDRVSALRALYGAGPIPMDHKRLGEQALQIRTVVSETVQHRIFRRSASSGDVHPIGGFTGRAIYEGDLSPFLPTLRAASFTGIGRKTVWGNGRISTRTLRSA